MTNRIPPYLYYNITFRVKYQMFYVIFVDFLNFFAKFIKSFTHSYVLNVNFFCFYVF